VNNREFGNTPLFADLSRGDEHIIRIELPGYQRAELTITKSVSGWVWGNIFFGGLIGLAVDAITGGLYNLSPEQINAELRKGGENSFLKQKDIYIYTNLEPDPNWKQIGALAKNGG
jgi:hypothetical protein